MKSNDKNNSTPPAPTGLSTVHRHESGGVLFKKCQKCGESYPLSWFCSSYPSRCRQCFNVYAREYRYNHRVQIGEYRKKRTSLNPHIAAHRSAEYRRRNPMKWAARWKTAEALKRGKLKKGLCVICGTCKVEAHHEDYTQPLNIVWLCRRHHAEYHLAKTNGWNWAGYMSWYNYAGTKVKKVSIISLRDMPTHRFTIEVQSLLKEA